VIAAVVLATASFVWPVPEGWKHETIPFPLEFAPELPYQGVEELRFAPGMFKPDQPDFWSYAFVWWLDGRPALGAAELSASLERYFAGLCVSVAKEKGQTVDPSRISASLRVVNSSPRKLGHKVASFTGIVESYDPFATGKPIVLNVEAWVWDCDRSGKRAVMVLASPQPQSAAVWTSLRKRRDEFACHER
jgi:hypothetical protein